MRWFVQSDSLAMPTTDTELFDDLYLLSFPMAMAYEIVILLVVTCFYDLWRGRRRYTGRYKWFLVSFISVMFLLSTGDVVKNILSIMHALVTPFSSPAVGIFGIPITLSGQQYARLATMLPYVFTIWGADFFMVSALSENQNHP